MRRSARVLATASITAIAIVSAACGSNSKTSKTNGATGAAPTQTPAAKAAAGTPIKVITIYPTETTQANYPEALAAVRATQAHVRAERLIQRVNLHLALGGGFDAPEEHLEPKKEGKK